MASPIPLPQSAYSGMLGSSGGPLGGTVGGKLAKNSSVGKLAKKSLIGRLF